MMHVPAVWPRWQPAVPEDDDVMFPQADMADAQADRKAGRQAGRLAGR